MATIPEWHLLVTPYYCACFLSSLINNDDVMFPFPFPHSLVSILFFLLMFVPVSPTPCIVFPLLQHPQPLSSINIAYLPPIPLNNFHLCINLLFLALGPSISLSDSHARTPVFCFYLFFYLFLFISTRFMIIIILTETTSAQVLCSYLPYPTDKTIDQ